jgi:hypothetical protein
MTEAPQPRGIETLSQTELGEAVAVGSELFNQLYDRAEQVGEVQIGEARVTARRRLPFESIVLGHEDDRNYDEQTLVIDIQEEPNVASTFEIRKFPPDRVATWGVDILHTNHDNPNGLSYKVVQMKEPHEPEGKPAGYKIGFTQGFNRPDIARYQQDVQTLRHGSNELDSS